MAATQATFGEIESNASEPDKTVPRQLKDASTVCEGDKIMLERLEHDASKAYEVLETRSNSLTIARDGNEITLRRRAGDWYHGRTDFTHDVFLIENGEHRLLKCSECGEARDPADFARRVNYSYICAGCDK